MVSLQKKEGSEKTRQRAEQRYRAKILKKAAEEANAQPAAEVGLKWNVHPKSARFIKHDVRYKREQVLFQFYSSTR